MPDNTEASDSRTLDSPNPPTARRTDFQRTFWGDTRKDPYQWLEDRSSPEVLAHLGAENEYTEAVLAPVAELRSTLFEEIKSRIKETDMSVPIVKDGWSYYSRTTEGSPYSAHYRRPVAVGQAGVEVFTVSEVPTDDEQLLLDENVEAGDDEFFDIGIFDVSPNHDRLLWGADRTGDERYKALVRDLATGEDLDEGLIDLSYGSAWALDNETFFYVKPDPTNRPYQVWRHRLGRQASEDVCVFEEPDERFFVGIGRDKDDSYIHIAVSSKITDEVRILPADQPDGEFVVVAERRQGVEYSMAHHDDQFVILTNDNAENFRVMTAPESDPSPANWIELLPTRPDVMISDIDVSRQFLTLFERTEGITRLQYMNWSTKEIAAIDQPEAVSTTWPGANPDYEATSIRYGYSSMVTPPSVFLFDVETQQRTLLKQTEVLGDFQSDDYVSERQWVDVGEGVKVPLSVVRRRDCPEGPGPCLLYGYGAYEASIEPTFSPARLSLLDRNFRFVIVHARGGGEMGRSWYLNGKFEHKQNTFSDVIVAADHLIKSGQTSPNQLVLRGGSAGGLMAGAVVNQAPDRFAGIVAQVPFVDALNTILDPEQPLTVTEWEEWGNPIEDEATYSTMKAYSPYDNVEAIDYPSILATGGLHDTRVNYWEPAKWVQLLRHERLGERPILLWTDLAAGHGGPSGRYDTWHEEARILAYILWVAGQSSHTRA